MPKATRNVVHAPRATYRLQLNARFPFGSARGLLPYLDALGVSGLYGSPIVAARAGSTHGHDVTDPSRIDPELGDTPALEALVGGLRRRGMGLLLDVVPNHRRPTPRTRGGPICSSGDAGRSTRSGSTSTGRGRSSRRAARWSCRSWGTSIRRFWTPAS